MSHPLGTVLVLPLPSQIAGAFRCTGTTRRMTMDPVRDAELHRGLEEKLGATVATGLMERLPPAPVDRLATKTTSPS